MTAIITTLGLKRASELGVILPHEHIFANFDSLDHGDAHAVKPETVLDHMGPSLHAAQAGCHAAGRGHVDRRRPPCRHPA